MPWNFGMPLSKCRFTVTFFPLIISGIPKKIVHYQRSILYNLKSFILTSWPTFILIISIYLYWYLLITKDWKSCSLTIESGVFATGILPHKKFASVESMILKSEVEHVLTVYIFKEKIIEPTATATSHELKLDLHIWFYMDILGIYSPRTSFGRITWNKIWQIYLYFIYRICAFIYTHCFRKDSLLNIILFFF